MDVHFASQDPCTHPKQTLVSFQQQDRNGLCRQRRLTTSISSIDPNGHLVRHGLLLNVLCALLLAECILRGWEPQLTPIATLCTMDSF